MSTHYPTSLETGGDRLGNAWDALSDAEDWCLFALAWQALARESLAAGMAVWQDSMARVAHSQGELVAALGGACRESTSAWETPWWTQRAAADAGAMYAH